MTDNNAEHNDKIEPRETITIEVPLDEVRQTTDVELRKAGIDVEELATAAAMPAVDQRLVEVHDQSKYSGGE